MNEALIKPQQAAEILWQARRQGQSNPQALRGVLSVEDGYRTQMLLLARHKEHGDVQAGWKLGATAPAVRKLFGSDTAVTAHLLARNRIAAEGPSGGCAALTGAVNPCIEAELLLVLGAPLQGPGVTAEQARAAVAAVAPAFEIVDFWSKPSADPGLAVAENVYQRAYVIGPELRPCPAGFDPGALHMTLTRDGETAAGTSRQREVVAEGLGREVVDNQFESLAFLANTLAAYGAALEAGQIVLTGSFNAPPPVAPGQTWRAEFAGLGAVTVRFT